MLGAVTAHSADLFRGNPITTNTPTGMTNVILAIVPNSPGLVNLVNNTILASGATNGSLKVNGFDITQTKSLPTLIQSYPAEGWSFFSERLLKCTNVVYVAPQASADEPDTAAIALLTNTAPFTCLAFSNGLYNLGTSSIPISPNIVVFGQDFSNTVFFSTNCNAIVLQQRGSTLANLCISNQPSTGTDPVYQVPWGTPGTGIHTNIALVQCLLLGDTDALRPQSPTNTISLYTVWAESRWDGIVWQSADRGNRLFGYNSAFKGDDTSLNSYSGETRAFAVNLENVELHHCTIIGTNSTGQAIATYAVVQAAGFVGDLAATHTYVDCKFFSGTSGDDYDFFNGAIKTNWLVGGTFKTNKFGGALASQIRIAQSGLTPFSRVDTSEGTARFASGLSVTGGSLTNVSSAGSGVRLVVADANGKYSATFSTNVIGTGGSGTNYWSTNAVDGTISPVSGVTGVVIGSAPSTIGLTNGVVWAFEGFTSRSNFITLMPTNAGSIGDVLTATGIEGGRIVHTKYATPTGGGSGMATNSGSAWDTTLYNASGLKTFDNNQDPKFYTAGGLMMAINTGSDSVTFGPGAEAFIDSAGNISAASLGVGPVNVAGALTVAAGVTANGGGLKHKRITTGSITAGSTALVTVTWDNAFADADYTVQASVVDSTTSSLSLSVVHVESVTDSAVTVRVINNSAGSLTGTLHVLAIHD